MRTNFEDHLEIFQSEDLHLLVCGHKKSSAFESGAKQP